MRRTLALAALALLAGCKPYTALPLDAKARSAALAGPDLARITVQGRDLSHPVLAPLAIDLSNGLSPDEAAVLSVFANPDLRAVRDQRALAAAQLLDAGLLPDPVLSLSRDVPSGGEPGLVTAHSASLSLDLTSLLTRGLRRRAARAEQASVDLDVAWQEWQVAEAAKVSVYRLLALDPQVDLAEATARAWEEALQALEKSAQSGATSLGDLASARAALDGARRATLALAQARERENQALNALLGLPPSTRLPLERPSPRTWSALPSQEALLRNLDRRLDLLALERGYESEDARLRLAVWSQFPAIGISFTRARDTSNVLTHGTGVAFSLPIFNRGQGLVAVEQATRRQLHDQYLSRLLRARADLAQAYADLASQRAMIAAGEQALPSLEAQARASETSFREGQMDLPGRNQARLALASQQATLAALQGSLDELGVALELASGRPLSSPEIPR